MWEYVSSSASLKASRRSKSHSACIRVLPTTHVGNSVNPCLNRFQNPWGRLRVDKSCFKPVQVKARGSGNPLGEQSKSSFHVLLNFVTTRLHVRGAPLTRIGQGRTRCTVEAHSRDQGIHDLNFQRFHSPIPPCRPHNEPVETRATGLLGLISKRLSDSSINFGTPLRNVSRSP